MQLNSIKKLNSTELDQISGGLVKKEEIFKRALAAGLIKATADFLASITPKANTDTILGKACNSLVNGTLTFISNCGWFFALFSSKEKNA